MPGQALQISPLRPQEKGRAGPGGKGPVFTRPQSITPKGEQGKYLTDNQTGAAGPEGKQLRCAKGSEGLSTLQ